MERLSCIIFDLDGTLTRTNELIYATFNHVAKQYLDAVFTPKEITAMFGPPEEVAIERLVGSERRDRALDDFYAFYAQHHPTMASAYDGIREMLDELRARGIRLAIFTGKGRRTALITLAEIGLKDHFDLVVTGSDVKNHKPSADGIRMVLEQFQLRADEVLMVGDGVADVKAAREAGVAIASVLWDSYGKDQLMEMEVDYRFHNVSEFVAWLGRTIPGFRVAGG